jgi:uncharacterized protein Yka (UPF0111/DUF47 family)
MAAQTGPATETLPLVERVAKLAARVAPEREPEHRLSSISQAIDEVMQIIETLKHVVEQMEDVLEMAEVAERQKLADEREIDSLRRALRQLQQRPREREGRRE